MLYCKHFKLIQHQKQIHIQPCSQLCWNIKLTLSSISFSLSNKIKKYSGPEVYLFVDDQKV